MDLTPAIALIISAVFVAYMVYDGWKIHKDTKKERAKLLEDQIKCYGDFINLGINQRDAPIRYRWVDDDTDPIDGGHSVIIGNTIFYGVYSPYFRCDICGASIKVQQPDQIEFIDPNESNRCQGACGCKKIMDTAEEHQSD